MKLLFSLLSSRQFPAVNQEILFLAIHFGKLGVVNGSRASAQITFECLQEWWLHNLSEQPVPEQVILTVMAALGDIQSSLPAQTIIFIHEKCCLFSVPVQTEPPVSVYAHCLVTWQHCKEIHLPCTLSSNICTHRWETPAAASLLQTGQSQLSQPLLILCSLGYCGTPTTRAHC